MNKKLRFALFAAIVIPNISQAAATNAEMECLLNWAESSFPQLFTPAQAPSQTAAPYYYRQYTSTLLAINLETQHAWLRSGGAEQDLGEITPFIGMSGCGTTTPSQPISYAGTWTWSAGPYYSVQLVLTQNGNHLTAQIPSTGQHFTGTLNGTTAVFNEDDGKATAQATVTQVNANTVNLRMDSCSPALMCMLQAGMEIQLTR